MHADDTGDPPVAVCRPGGQSASAGPPEAGVPPLGVPVGVVPAPGDGDPSVSGSVDAEGLDDGAWAEGFAAPPAGVPGS